MGELAMALCGGILIVLGFIGCVVPVLPGPVLAYSALWILVAFGVSPGSTCLLTGAAVVVGAMAVDYVLPALCAKKFKCSGLGVFGCTVGTVVGLFFLPLGLILGPFLGTVCGELIAGKGLADSLRGGLGAFLGFVFCLVVKFAAVALFAVWFVRALP